jgi:hypothetical protein
MTDRVRIIQHEIIPDCGSFEVVIPGKPSRYFYFEDNPGRRLRPEQVDRETAKRQAQEFAREEQEKLK